MSNSPVLNPFSSRGALNPSRVRRSYGLSLVDPVGDLIRGNKPLNARTILDPGSAFLHPPRKPPPVFPQVDQDLMAAKARQRRIASRDSGGISSTVFAGNTASPTGTSKALLGG